MKTIRTVQEIHSFSREKKTGGKTIALVPTMGYLHEGHLSLVKKAKEIADVVVVSIFVNPTQFAPNEDFSSYPRDEERDKELLEKQGVDAVFIPSAEEIYTKNFQTYVEVNEITRSLEGETRPTHFKGVTTIVSILFNCVKPDYAVFGQKDAQQAAVIKRMVNDLKFDIEIIIAPIIRESDGLAKSSRNLYLSGQERIDALVLSKSLQAAKEIIEKGEKNVERIIKEMEHIISSVNSSKLDYIKIVDTSSFSKIEELKKGNDYYILIACKIGKTRLIDNLLISI